MMQEELNTQILAVEYQGYGICEGEATEDSVLTDASRVLNFVLNVLCRQPEDVIVMGRSIGTGPACYLASTTKVGALVLISPHTSIRGVVKFMFGSILQYFVKERFTNYERIQQVNCPTFILHGEKDTVIPVEHSRTLAELCKAPTKLIISSTMDHSSFNFMRDFIEPMIDFLESNSIFIGVIKPIKLPTSKGSLCLMTHKPYFSYLSISDHSSMTNKGTLVDKLKPNLQILEEIDSLCSNIDESESIYESKLSIPNTIKPKHKRKSRMIVSKIRYFKTSQKMKFNQSKNT